ncbi:MAG: hypothetical protein ACRYG2_01050 [Janthinobacterium lividum]
MSDEDLEDGRAGLRLRGIVLATPEPVALGAFYARLLGWPYRSQHPSGWCCSAPTGARA